MEPGLTLCDQVIQGQKAIDCTKHLAFVEGITQMTDKILKPWTRRLRFHQLLEKGRVNNSKDFLTSYTRQPLNLMKT